MRACPSCGHETEQPNYCEQCGAALAPVDVVEDTALSLMLGLVCEKCDSYNDPGTAACVVCGNSLAEESGANRPPSTPPPGGDAPPAWMSAPDGEPLATVNAMPAVDLASLKQDVPGIAAPAAPEPVVTPEPPPPAEPVACSMCNNPLELDDKFCRNCGTKVGADVKSTMMISNAAGGVAVGQPGPAATQVLAAVAPPGSPLPAGLPQAPPGGGASTLFFGAVQPQRMARLVLVKGASDGGAHWRLEPGETTIGRSASIAFAADPHLAPVQCKVLFTDAGLELLPVDPKNGVYVSVGQKVQLAPGDEFVVGTQRILILEDDARDQIVPPPTSDDTPMLGSMMPGPPNIIVRRIFQRADLEEVYVRAQRLLTIGRNLCDVNFPTDPYLSVRHAQLARSGTGYVLEDLGSRNGTYVRVTKPHPLKHGDAVMVGDQVLRVELSA
jgi:hypothetical protein